MDRELRVSVRYLPRSHLAFVLEQVRGNFIVLGACPPENDLALAPTNHSATVEFDDRVLIDGAQVYAEVALRHLSE